MKIFSIKVRIDKNSGVEYFFDMELIQQNQPVESVELDGYYETPCEPFILIGRVIATLRKWQELLNKLDDDEKLFLIIGIWDEYVSGFYFKKTEQGLEIQYGSILDWGYMYNREEYTRNLDESILHVEYNFVATKEDFMQDIIDNIAYLEMEIKKTKKIKL